jgi:hypothetical protein
MPGSKWRICQKRHVSGHHQHAVDAAAERVRGCLYAGNWRSSPRAEGTAVDLAAAAGVATFVKRVSETDILMNNLNANSLGFERMPTSKGVKVILSCLLSQIRRQKIRRTGKGEWVEEDRIMNTKPGFTRAFAIVSGVAIAAITSSQANSMTRKDRCPYFPSSVVCRGDKSATTGARQSASYFRSNRSPSHHKRK